MLSSCQNWIAVPSWHSRYRACCLLACLLMSANHQSCGTLVFSYNAKSITAHLTCHQLPNVFEKVKVMWKKQQQKKQNIKLFGLTNCHFTETSPSFTKPTHMFLPVYQQQHMCFSHFFIQRVYNYYKKIIAYAYCVGGGACWSPKTFMSH